MAVVHGRLEKARAVAEGRQANPALKRWEPWAIQIAVSIALIAVIGHYTLSWAVPWLGHMLGQALGMALTLGLQA